MLVHSLHPQFPQSNHSVLCCLLEAQPNFYHLHIVHSTKASPCFQRLFALFLSAVYEEFRVFSNLLFLVEFCVVAVSLHAFACASRRHCFPVWHHLTWLWVQLSTLTSSYQVDRQFLRAIKVQSPAAWDLFNPCFKCLEVGTMLINAFPCSCDFWTSALLPQWASDLKQRVNDQFDPRHVSLS